MWAIALVAHSPAILAARFARIRILAAIVDTFTIILIRKGKDV